MRLVRHCGGESFESLADRADGVAAVRGRSGRADSASPSVTAILVVVEPESMPRYASPEYPLHFPFSHAVSGASEAIHVPYASAGKMRGRRGVAESGAVPAGGCDMNSESFIRPLPSQCSAAPHAG